MKGSREVYADGIGRIHFAGGMVRYDFVSMEPARSEAAVSAGSRIIMPPQGFLNMFNSMRELIDKLVAAGILQKNDASQKGGMPITAPVVIDEEKNDAMRPEAAKAASPKSRKKSKK